MRQIVELKTLLGGEPLKAIELFERIVTEGDDSRILEASQALANYIRHSSIYKRRILYQKIQELSLLSRLYLSFQFNTFNDFTFPKKFIFNGSSLFDPESSRDEQIASHHHYLTAVGSNRFFNLGLLSDGSPVSEPHIVNLPRVMRVEMSNTHTVFMTIDRKIYGCGKAASFLPDRIEEHDGGYVALPTLIDIPKIDKTKSVLDVKVTEGGTQLLIGRKEWYYIGKCPPNTSETRRISSNCSVLVEKTPENLENPENPPAKVQSANVSFDGKIVQVFLRKHQPEPFSLFKNGIDWDRNSSFSAPKRVQFVINGFPGIPVHQEFDDFQVLNDGTIYAVKSGLVKGKLELWKNKDDGFKVKTGTVLEHFDTKYTLVAVVHEVPDTIGTDFFKVSPDGQNLIMKKGKEKLEKWSIVPKKVMTSSIFRSIQTHKLIRNREKQFDPVDVEMEITLNFLNTECENPDKDYTEEQDETDFQHEKFRTNRLLFEMIYPEYVKLIQPDGHVYFYHDNNDCDLVIDWQRPIPESIELVPQNTEKSSIWYFISSEKIKIPCHKNLILLHSRQLTSMQRFNSNYGSFGNFGQEEEEKPVEIEMNATVETIRNALKAMIDIRTLYEIKTIELIDCINFYDYHLMEEMFHDSMHILIDTLTEHTLPFIFELFHSYDDQVIDGIARRPELVWSSNSIPPKEFLIRFAEKLAPCYSMTRPRGPLHPETLSTYEPDYVIKSLVNLDEDSEDIIWNSLRDELHDPLATWHSEAMKKKEEKRETGRRRNSSHTYRPETEKIGRMAMTSSPIAIGGRAKTESFSKSLNSPNMVQSPVAQSMSPIGKALPYFKPRHDSISNSLEDFPEVGCSPTTPKSATGSSGGRFAPKGTRFKKDMDILKSPPPANPWKIQPTGGGPSIWEDEEDTFKNSVVKFDEVVKKEEKLQRNIRTGYKKVQLLPHVELEELAVAQISEVFGQELGAEALISVELVSDDDIEVENEQIIWGNMPGLVRR